MDPETIKQLNVEAQKRDADNSVVDRALEIVQDFIAERGLVMYGGLAIDYALRLKGRPLYPEGERPDFDAMSADSVTDAYDLADRLHAAGLPHVSAIRAIHVQTMRVRVDFITVADIGFAPRAVMDRIPTLEFTPPGAKRPLRLVHPHWQHLDQHLAFCFPFANPPMEDLYHRAAKDHRRYNLLQSEYPIPASEGPPPEMEQIRLEFDPAQCAVHGFAAFAVLREMGQRLEGMAGGKLGGAPTDPTLTWKALPGGRVSLEYAGPAKSEVAVASTRVDVALDTCSVGGDQAGQLVHRWRPIMDARPDVAGRGRLRVYNTAFRLLAVAGVEVPEVDAPVHIVNAQYLLLYFLLRHHLGEDPHALGYYRATLDIIAQAVRAFEAMADRVPAEVLGKIINSTPFCLSTNVMGDLNVSAARMVLITSELQQARRELPDDSPLHGHLPDLTTVPCNYYPGKARPTFDYAGSPLFQQDGRAVD